MQKTRSVPPPSNCAFLPPRLTRDQQILIAKPGKVTRQGEQARRKAAVTTSQMRDRRRGYGRLRS